MLTLTFFNDDVLTIPESAIANFKALGITNSLRFKHGHWIKDSTAQAVELDLYIEQLKSLKTSANSVDPASDKTALDNLLDGDYQVISFEHDNDGTTYVVWQSAEGDESINQHQAITKEVTPNGEVLRIIIVNEKHNKEKVPKGLFLIFFGLLHTQKTSQMGASPQTPFSFRKSLDFRLHICKYCDILISQAWTKSLHSGRR